MRLDDHGGLSVLLVGSDTAVGDEWHRLVDRLEVLESNVLSALELDEVLDTVDDRDCSIRVPLSNVTSLEPTARLGESLLVEVWTLVVALEERRSTDEDLSLRRVVCAQVSSLGCVDKLDLSTRDWSTDSVVGHPRRVEDTGHGGTLGKTVTLDHHDKSCGEEVLGGLGDGATTVEHDLQATTSLSADLAEDNSVTELGETRDTSGLGLEGSIEDSLLDGTTVLNLGSNTLADKLPDLRYADHDRRADLHDIALAFADGCVGKGLHTTVGDRKTGEYEGHFHGEFEDMGKGKEGKVDIGRLKNLAENGPD